MGATASSAIPIKCGPTVSNVKGTTRMLEGEYISRIYVPFLGAPPMFRGKPLVLCASASPLGGLESYVGAVTGRSEYIYSPLGFMGYRVYKDRDGIVQKLEFYPNVASGTDKSQIKPFVIATDIGRTLTSWTTEKMENQGMVATSISWEIAGEGAENNVGNQVYLLDISMDFAVLTTPTRQKQLPQKRRVPRWLGKSPNAEKTLQLKQKQAEECAARLVKEKKQQSRVHFFRYRIVPTIVLAAVIVPFLFS